MSFGGMYCMLKKVKKKNEKKSSNNIVLTNDVISRRILFLAGIIFICFLAIFVRLFYIQVVQNEDYIVKKDDYTSIKQYVSAPRGQIYDTKGNVLARTVVTHNIIYTSPKSYSTDDYLLYADRVVSVFDVKKDSFTERDKKEAYMTMKSLVDSDDPTYNCNHLLTKKERKEYASGAWGSNAESTRYGLVYSRISKKNISEMSDKELKTYVVYQRMTTNASSGQENVILEDVSDDDVSYLVEHKTEFPGFDVDFGGWKREYPYGETLSDVIGTVSTSTEGLPVDNLNYFLQRGYSYNAPVGKSGLEFQYNDLLAGISEESKITYDSNGLAKKEIIRSAQKGNDLYLTIDVDMQQYLDSVLKDILEKNAGTKGRENFSSLFMCMMNPKNGGVLALSGYQMDLKTRKMTYFASGNYVLLANPGSCIKGATVYMGLSEGVVSPGEVIMDKTMNIAGQEFSSFKEWGPVDDVRALSVSSNIYMFQVAIRLAHGSYVEGEPLNLENATGTFDLMRSYYSMFGLGNKTGLDIPDESTGYMGVGIEPGMLLNYAIGQFDMYTPVQMLQYVSVIAANGKMYQPQFAKYFKEVNSNQVLNVYEPRLKSTLPEKNSDYLTRVQMGFRACVEEGNCGNALKDLNLPIAAKTGTAEVGEWTTANLVGYAPYSDPNIAFACVSPTSSINDQSVSPNICSNSVVPPVMEKYFELYPQ